MSPDEVSALGERGLFVRDHFAGAEAASAVRARVAALPMNPAGLGRARLEAPSLRGDRIAWLDAQDEPALYARFEALRCDVNQAAWLGLERFDVQAARYDPGAAYARHRDAFRGGPSRRLTAIWYLNPGWEASHGGILRLHLEDDVVDVEPVLDRLVVFLSEKIEHEVLAATAPRLAVTAWYYGP